MLITFHLHLVIYLCEQSVPTFAVFCCQGWYNPYFSATMNVLLIGHSFLRRLEDFMVNHDLPPTFNIGDIDKISWCHRGGLCVTHLWDNCQPTELLWSTIQALQPTHVYFELGTNDLTQATPSQSLMVASAMLQCAEWLCQRGCGTVICGNILPRLPDIRNIPLVTKMDYCVDLQHFRRNFHIFNNFLEATLPEVTSHSRSWSHSQLESRPNLFHKDGVHLSSGGNRRLYHDIRGVLLYMAQHN